ncbi:MAG: TolC family protein [Wenzhouxiangella sp.]|jgi:outer membrane protein TolC|nr:TolC family protein [Wenzhouxiangella sp.]
MLYKSAVCGLLLSGALAYPCLGSALSIDAAIEQALARDAGLLELERRARALDHLAVADGALPDPELTFGAEGLPIDDPTSADMMTMYRIGLRQRFPAGDSRRLSADRTSAQARAIQADARARSLEVALQTRLAFLDYASARASAERVDAMRAQLAQLVSITQRRFQAGTGRLQDESQALLELALLERRQVDAGTAVDDARARLQRWTGPWNSNSIVDPLPDWSLEPISNEAMDGLLADHPELVAAGIRVDAGDIGAELARQAYRPRWMIEAGYGHQRGKDPSGQRMSDKLFVMGTVSLPLFTADRQDRRVDAALAERDAQQARQALILQRLSGELSQQQALRVRLAERRALLEERILPRAQETVDATLTAYEADRASFDELISARLRQLEIDLDLIETRRRQQAVIARIASLTNKDLP